jgi:hypothetical protein
MHVILKETNMNLLVASISILLSHKVHQLVIYSSAMWMLGTELSLSSRGRMTLGVGEIF